MLFPEDISEHGHLLDALFNLTVYLTAAAFAAVILLLGFFLIRYAAKPGRKAFYTRGDSRGAVLLTLALALAVFVGIDVNLAYHDHFVFEKLFGEVPEEKDALVVDVVAETFAWNFRYAGPDGKFGANDLKAAEGTDPFGLAGSADEAAKDDLVSVGVLTVPSNKPVLLRMTSRDVIHSLFLPNLRIKQDVVPGLRTEMHFKALREGEFEIACAELCGLGHYKMRGFLKVLPAAEFDAWLAKSQSEANEEFVE